MKPPLNRRHFLQKAGVAAAGTALLATTHGSRALAGPNDKVVVAIMGCNGRGMDHIGTYLTLPNVEIGYVCDVDSRAIDRGVAAISKLQARRPKGVKDFRVALDDKNVAGAGRAQAWPHRADGQSTPELAVDDRGDAKPPRRGDWQSLFRANLV